MTVVTVGRLVVLVTSKMAKVVPLPHAFIE
jgi:hypothetical protein